MQGQQSEVGYFKRLLLALAGRDAAGGGLAAVPEVSQVPAEDAREVAAAPASEEEARLRAKVASLEMDLAERERRIEAMRAEYEALGADKRRAESGAGEQVLAELFGKIASTLSNMSAMGAWMDQGKQVDAGDLVRLGRELENKLGRFGLERLGTAGETVGFDVAAHQRMSGGSVHEGAEVIVQMPGFRVGKRVVLKAMVSARED